MSGPDAGLPDPRSSVAASPATTVFFPACSRTLSVPALSPGQSFQVSGGCGNDYIIDPQGLLNQSRANDFNTQVCIL